MKMKLYAVLDAKIGDFGNPFTMQTDDVALRAFVDSVNDGSNPNNMWFRHPEDFMLYQIAEYDTCTAEIISAIPPKALMNAAAVKRNDIPVFDVSKIVKNGVDKVSEVV